MILHIALGMFTMVNITVIATKMLTIFFCFDLTAKDILLDLKTSLNLSPPVMSFVAPVVKYISTSPDESMVLLLLLGGKENELLFFLFILTNFSLKSSCSSVFLGLCFSQSSIEI